MDARNAWNDSLDTYAPVILRKMHARARPLACRLLYVVTNNIQKQQLEVFSPRFARRRLLLLLLLLPVVGHLVFQTERKASEQISPCGLGSSLQSCRCFPIKQGRACRLRRRRLKEAELLRLQAKGGSWSSRANRVACLLVERQGRRRTVNVPALLLPRQALAFRH